MKTNFLSVVFLMVLFAALFNRQCAVADFAGSSGEITVFERVYSVDTSYVELPAIPVPSLEEQITLYRNLYMPYSGRVGEEPQFAISGFEDLIDIAFSYAWKQTRGKSDFKKPILEMLYAHALADAAQNCMTLAAFKQHILRLGVVLSVNAQGPFRNKNLKFFNEKSYELYFRNPDQINASTWMFEAILFSDIAQIDYGIFVGALADKNMPLLVSVLCTNTPPGFGNAAGFLRHDYGHNYRTAAYANIPTIGYIIDRIKDVKPQLDAKDKVLLFYMFHELMLRNEQNDSNNPDKAFHTWCSGTKKRIAEAFLGQIADDARLKSLIIPDCLDSNSYRRGFYEVIATDVFQFTLVGKSQPLKNYLRAIVTITGPGKYHINVFDIGVKLLQDPGFMNAFKADQNFNGLSPLNIYAGETENKMFQERIEDLKYIYGDEGVASLAKRDNYSLLLLLLQTFDNFYNEYRHLFE